MLLVEAAGSLSMHTSVRLVYHCCAAVQHASVPRIPCMFHGMCRFYVAMGCGALIPSVSGHELSAPTDKRCRPELSEIWNHIRCASLLSS